MAAQPKKISSAVFLLHISFLNMKNIPQCSLPFYCLHQTKKALRKPRRAFCCYDVYVLLLQL